MYVTDIWGLISEKVKLDCEFSLRTEVETTFSKSSQVIFRLKLFFTAIYWYLMFQI